MCPPSEKNWTLHFLQFDLKVLKKYRYGIKLVSVGIEQAIYKYLIEKNVKLLFLRLTHFFKFQQNKVSFLQQYLKLELIL